MKEDRYCTHGGFGQQKWQETLDKYDEITVDRNRRIRALYYLFGAYKNCRGGYVGTLSEIGHPEIWYFCGTRKEIFDAVKNPMLFPKSEIEPKKEEEQ